MMAKQQPKTKEQKERRRANRKAGKCSCGQDRWPPYRRCKACVLGNRKSSRERMARLRPIFEALHLCSKCFKRQAVDGSLCCGLCQEYNSDYKTEKAAGRIKSLPRREA